MTDVAEMSWGEQNAEGRRQAAELIAKLQDGDRPFLLGDAIKAMIEKGTYGGVEVGFCQRIAAELS